MTKFKKKGFTIVELVIVIAVIAILAAVLIPTFSNIIKKAQLNADKQAVREMNMALAADEAANGYGKNMNVEDAMYVLGIAGYNTDNWACLTNGYQVYWYEKENRMILYNSGTAEIEYPEEYIGKKVKIKDANGNSKEVDIMLTNLVHIYNENHIKAQQFNMSLSDAIKTDSSGNVSGTTEWTGTGTSAIESTTTINGVATQSIGNSSVNLEQLHTHTVTIATALGLNSTDSVYMYATKEDVSADTNGAYASLQICAVGAEATLQNNGSVKENLYYLTIVNNNGTEAQISSARKAAAQYVYNIFDQITEGKIDDDVTVIIDNGITIDCSLGGADWAPCKTFTGYFGCPNGTITIDGANLTSKTGYAQTVSFMGSIVDGSSSMYYVTGFFGTIYGNTTIENVVFKNLNINSPCIDAIAAAEGKAINATKRNTVAVIGGITDGFTGPATDQEKQNAPIANVIIQNVRVDDSCSITGAGCVGGLIGYIGCGSGDNSFALKGNITIKDCYVGGSITSLDTTCGNQYGEVGGLLSFTTRCNSTNLNIVVDSCVVSAVLKGYYYIGAAMSRMQSGKIEFKGENDFSGTKFDLSNHLNNYNYSSNGSPVWAIGAACDSAKILFTDIPVYSTEAALGYYAPTEVTRNTKTVIGLNDTIPQGISIS